jgi:HEAT repeat protein
LFQIAQLPRTLEAAIRDAFAKRVEVRKSALTDLVRYADGDTKSTVVTTLRQLLRKDTDAEVRSLTAIACADAEVSELIPDLLEALTDENPRVTQMALLALGELPFAAIDAEVAQISIFLDSELPALRYQALSTLYRLRQADTVSRLWLALRDPDPEIRWLGWQLLDDWQGKVDADPSLLGTEWNLREPVRLQELSVLAEQSPPKVLVEAGLLLLRLKEPSVLELLLPLLERSRGLDAGQVERVILRLGEVNCRASVPWLSKRARTGWFEGPFGWVSLCALAQLGERTARDAIVAELRSSSARRRCRALAAVRTLHLTEAVGMVESLAKTGVAGLTASEVEAALSELRHDQS